jgi:hypothetical protein
MLCGQCHQEFDGNLSACPYCGTPVSLERPIDQTPASEAGGSVEMQQEKESSEQQYQQAPQQPYAPQEQQYQQAPQQPYMMNSVNKSKGFATASMVCGIIGLILCWTPFGIGLALNIVAIVCFVLSRRNLGPGQQSGMGIAGLVCGIIGLAISIIFTITWGMVFSMTEHLSSPSLWEYYY